MRQTSKRARRSRALMIVIFVLLAALVIWGLTARITKHFLEIIAEKEKADV